MSTSSSLCLVTPYFVNMDTLPWSDVFPTLIGEVGNSVNVSASANFLDSCGNGSDRGRTDKKSTSTLVIRDFFKFRAGQFF